MQQALKREERDVDGIISTGFCGALDPALASATSSYADEVPMRLRASVRAGCDCTPSIA